MKKVTLITLALFTLLFSQCKKENIDNNNNIDTKKVKVRCEIPMGNGDKSDFTDLMTDGSINWSTGTERIYLAVHHEDVSKRQIIELLAEPTVSATTLAFEGEVPEDILVDGVEYEVWYFGNSHNLSDPYININRSNDVISNITGNIATQTGNLEDLGYHHIAKASVLATQETDGSFSLPLNGTLENQIAIAYVNLERDNSAVVNNLKGSAIVGTTFYFGYDGQKYTLNVSGSNQIAIRGTTTNPSESFVVLFPNNKKDVDLIADGRYLYNFNNPIEASGLYYRYISEVEIETLLWEDYVHELVDLGLPSGLKWATCNIGADQFFNSGNYYQWGAIAVNGSYYEGTDDISGNPQYDVATASWGEKWRMPTQEEMQELITNCDFSFVTEGNVPCMKAVSKKNDNFVFFPLAGMDLYGTLDAVGTSGYYWTSTPNINNTWHAYGLAFGTQANSVVMLETHFRWIGYSVRAVAE